MQKQQLQQTLTNIARIRRVTNLAIIQTYKKGKVKKVLWKSANFEKIADVTRTFYSAATTTTKHANKYCKNNRNKLSKRSDL